MRIIKGFCEMQQLNERLETSSMAILREAPACSVSGFAAPSASERNG